MKSYRTQDIRDGGIDRILSKLYGESELDAQRERYLRLADNFISRFSGENSGGEFFLFSSPGRTELGGNHTDHNHGLVLAGSIRLDKIAAVLPRDDNIVEVVTEGFPEDIKADLSNLENSPSEAGKAAELVRGIAAYFAEKGLGYGGFSAYIESRVAMGSGLSSSAAIEVLIGKIFSSLYNTDAVSAVELAKAGQYAENNFFHKPCGLMDQLACAVGGIISIDFKKPGEPVIERVPFDFRDHGYRLMIMDTGGDHADLTSEYAAIPMEMGCIARELGGQFLRDCDREQLLQRVPDLKIKCGDRAVLRALHFFRENDRVTQMLEALNFRDINSYLRKVEETGISSWTLLQNCIPTGAVQNQAVALSLAFLKELCPEGFFRVHGGGFAGTIQGYVPEENYETLRKKLEDQSKSGGEVPWRITPLSIRPEGVIQLGKE